MTTTIQSSTLTCQKPLIEIFGDEVKWMYPQDNLTVGHFSQIEPVKWENCRERFSSVMKKPDFKEFYFSIKPHNAENVAYFIWKTEELLQIKEKTTFNKTTHDQVLKINMSNFWLSSYVRRSLFTILTRLGNQYDSKTDNYEKVLFDPVSLPATGYNKTISAVKRFLYGFTFYDAPDPEYSEGTTLEPEGWCKLFNNNDSWRKLKKEDKKMSPIGLGKLWG